MQDTFEQFWAKQMLGKVEEKKKPRPKPPKYEIPKETSQRYFDAYRSWFEHEYPHAWKDGHYIQCKMPAYQTANGLTTFMTNYAKWMGGRGNNLQVMGRQVNGKHIKASTNKGTADTIIHHPANGVPFYAEVKVGKDRARPEQIAEQARIRRAGGIYEFVRTPMEFFELWDKVGRIQVVRAGDLFSSM